MSVFDNFEKKEKVQFKKRAQPVPQAVCDRIMSREQHRVEKTTASAELARLDADTRVLEASGALDRRTARPIVGPRLTLGIGGPAASDAPPPAKSSKQQPASGAAAKTSKTTNFSDALFDARKEFATAAPAVPHVPLPAVLDAATAHSKSVAAARDAARVDAQAAATASARLTNILTDSGEVADHAAPLFDTAPPSDKASRRGSSSGGQRGGGAGAAVPGDKPVTTHARSAPRGEGAVSRHLYGAPPLTDADVRAAVAAARRLGSPVTPALAAVTAAARATSVADALRAGDALVQCLRSGQPADEDSGDDDDGAATGRAIINRRRTRAAAASANTSAHVPSCRAAVSLLCSAAFGASFSDRVVGLRKRDGRRGGSGGGDGTAVARGETAGVPSRAALQAVYKDVFAAASRKRSAPSAVLSRVARGAVRRRAGRVGTILALEDTLVAAGARRCPPPRAPASVADATLFPDARDVPCASDAVPAPRMTLPVVAVVLAVASACPESASPHPLFTPAVTTMTALLASCTEWRCDAGGLASEESSLPQRRSAALFRPRSGAERCELHVKGTIIAIALMAALCWERAALSAELLHAAGLVRAVLLGALVGAWRAGSGDASARGSRRPSSTSAPYAGCPVGVSVAALADGPVGDVLVPLACGTAKGAPLPAWQPPDAVAGVAGDTPRPCPFRIGTPPTPAAPSAGRAPRPAPRALVTLSDLVDAAPVDAIALLAVLDAVVQRHIARAAVHCGLVPVLARYAALCAAHVSALRAVLPGGAASAVDAPTACDGTVGTVLPVWGPSGAVPCVNSGACVDAAGGAGPLAQLTPAHAKQTVTALARHCSRVHDVVVAAARACEAARRALRLYVPRVTPVPLYDPLLVPGYGLDEKKRRGDDDDGADGDASAVASTQREMLEEARSIRKQRAAVLRRHKRTLAEERRTSERSAAEQSRSEAAERKAGKARVEGLLREVPATWSADTRTAERRAAIQRAFTSKAENRMRRATSAPQPPPPAAARGGGGGGAPTPRTPR